MTLFFLAPLNEKSKEQQRVKDNLCLYICYFSEKLKKRNNLQSKIGYFK